MAELPSLGLLTNGAERGYEVLYLVMQGNGGRSKRGSLANGPLFPQNISQKDGEGREEREYSSLLHQKMVLKIRMVIDKVRVLSCYIQKQTFWNEGRKYVPKSHGQV